MRGVFLDIASLNPEDLDLGSLTEVIQDWTFHDYSEPEDVRQRICDADVIVTNKVRLDNKLIGSAHRLKLICIAATGSNNIDLESAKSHNIIVSNVRGYATASVSEHTFAMILTLIRHLDKYRLCATQGKWSSSRHFCVFDDTIQELSGMTLGIIGYGELGKAVARLAEAFSMQVLIAQRPGGEQQRGRIPLNELLSIADIVTIHCPLADNTRNLIGEHEFAHMKPGAILVNTARGGIVNEKDLLNALLKKQLAGAAVDVLTEEPPPADHPLLNANHPNLIVTPHVAWASQPARQRLLNTIVANISSFAAGNPVNRLV